MSSQRWHVVGSRTSDSPAVWMAVKRPLLPLIGHAEFRSSLPRLPCDAELVAFRVGHDEPGLSEFLSSDLREARRTQPFKSMDLLVDVVDKQI